MISRISRRTSVAALAATIFTWAAAPAGAVEYANIDVVDGATPTNTTAPTVSIPAGQNSPGFFVDPGSVVGEIPIRIGDFATDDAAGGILVVSPRETVRPAVDGPTQGLSPSTSTVRDDDITSVNTRDPAGGLAIVIDRAGSNQTNAVYPAGGPMNANVAAAYFPFADGWQGGTASASANNGPIDTFAGSAGITFSPTIGVTNTANVRPNYFNNGVVQGTQNPPVAYDPGNAVHNGHHFVSIPGVTDTRQQGILFAMHAKNEDNFATVSATINGDGWHVNTRGNNGAATSDSPNQGESKPFSFVFVPLGTPNVTMASIWGAAATGPGLAGVGGPVPILKSGANFTVTKMPSPNGRFRLAIDGQTPSSGVLLVGSESNFNGTGGLPADNNLTYAPDGDGWIIYSDDLQNVNTSPLNGQNGQIDEPVPYFHFAFMPFNAAPGAPTIAPAKWGKNSVFGYNINVQEFAALGNSNEDGATIPDPNNPGQTIPNPTPGVDMIATAGPATTGLTIQPIVLNRADNKVHVNGALPTETDGIMLATASEGFRDNTATGGTRSYGIASAYAAANGQWVTATSVADQHAGQRMATPVGIAGEANYNYSMAFFGRNSGFKMGTTATPTLGGLSTVLLADVSAAGVNDGVLMANNAENEDNFVTVTPKEDGSGWDITNWDNGSFTQNFPANYVYLPYTTQNLVAGRVNPDGTLINSTAPGGFTLTHEATGTYLLTVNGRTSSQGMLLLDGNQADHTLAYEAAGNSFRIFALDPVSQAEYEATVAELTLVDTLFQFAFIDYVTPPTLSQPNFQAADFNQDGSVNGTDLTRWQNGFGTGTTKGQGDADADSDVDGADFLVWQRQVGTTPPATAAAAAVPEPASALLVALAGAGLMATRRRAC